MRHVLAVLVENQPGVLVRVAGMFSRRGFNIESLAVGETHVPEYSRMTVTVSGDQAVVDQIVKQLNKLIEVISVDILPETASIARGLALIKVLAGEKRSEVLKLAEIFRAGVIDISGETVTLEITGDEEKIQALTGLLKPYGIAEFVSTGVIGLRRGVTTIYQIEECRDYEQIIL